MFTENNVIHFVQGNFCIFCTQMIFASLLMRWWQNIPIKETKSGISPQRATLQSDLLLSFYDRPAVGGASHSCSGTCLKHDSHEYLEYFFVNDIVIVRGSRRRSVCKYSLWTRTAIRVFIFIRWLFTCKCTALPPRYLCQGTASQCVLPCKSILFTVQINMVYLASQIYLPSHFIAPLAAECLFCAAKLVLWSIHTVAAQK